MKYLLILLFTFSLCEAGIDSAIRALPLKRPAAQSTLKWRSDLMKAFAEAQKTNRPLFVTFRCLPCKQCADFDKSVLDGGPQLSPTLKEFITVRLTDANQLDMEIFPFKGYQDLDLSWWGHFLSPQGQIYSVFGGRDHISDKTRISVNALKNSMERVLNHHYNKERKSWKVDGKTPKLKKKTPKPRDYPAFKEWKKDKPWVDKQTCIHCHQVSDILKYPAIQKGTFNKKKDFDIWPLPENLGLKVDCDHGLRVTGVKSGKQYLHQLQKGDEILALGDRKLFSQADLRGVLHRFDQNGHLPIWVKRHGKIMKSTITLKEGWRQPLSAEHLYWRKSVSDGPFGPYLGFWPLAGPKNRKGKVSVKPWFGKNNKGPAVKAGLRSHHIIIAVDGKSPAYYGRDFVAWVRMNYPKKGRIVLTVLERGKEKKITILTE